MPPAVGAVLERLRARLGDEAVRSLAAFPDHRPEFAGCVQGLTGPLPLPLGPRPLWLLPDPKPLPAANGAASSTPPVDEKGGPLPTNGAPPKPPEGQP